MKAYQADLAKFDETETQILGISVDSPFANKAFAEKLGVTFPLLSDIKHTASKTYGVFNDQGKYPVARRATFVVDKEGIIRHIEEGNSAISTAGAMEACSMLKKK